MQNADLKAIYSNLIAGRLPVGSASALKVVMNQAYAILGSNRLHVYCVERFGYVYYFAIESRYLASAPGFVLPFTEVLPDERLHEGDAIYLLKSGDFATALIIEGGNLRLLCNDIDVLKDYLIGLDMMVVEIDQGAGKPLGSVPQAIQGVSDRVGTQMMRVSLAVLVCSALTFVGVQGASALGLAKNQPEMNMRAVENDLNSTLGKLSVQQPLARQLSRIHKVSATVIRSGGWIQQYSMKGEGQETFEVVLPSWVSQDYLDALGRDVVTDLRDMEGLLTVRKVDKGNKK